MSREKIDAYKATVEIVKASLKESPLDITKSQVQEGVSEFAQALYDKLSEISIDAYRS